MKYLLEKDNKIGEECGVFGVFGDEGAAGYVYTGLFALQHRGQESCGIASISGDEICIYKDMGLVGDVFDEKKLEKLRGSAAIGHVRYSTCGQSFRENAQPLAAHYIGGPIAVSHNGNLVNNASLKRELAQYGSIFQTGIDSELIFNLIAVESTKGGSFTDVLKRVMGKMMGAYSLAILTKDKLIGVRDPNGFRPLCLGRRGKTYILASESCAIESIGARFIRDIEPGEIVTITKDGIESDKELCGKKTSLCVFEYIYFARPDSVIDDQSVYEAQRNAGRLLAKSHKMEGDLVIGVPDSGINAAIGYSEESGIPFGYGMIKNRYIGRTFIKPAQKDREDAVTIKLNAHREAIKGKSIIMIDDSIVRGTTSRQIVSILRRAGASKVSVLISCPPFMWPCYFGTDIPSKDELIACKLSVEEMRQELGADYLGFLPKEKIKDIAPMCKSGLCDACFTGNYPVQVPEKIESEKYDSKIVSEVAT